MNRFTLPVPVVATALVLLVSVSLAVLGQPNTTLQPRIAAEPVYIIATAQPAAALPVVEAGKDMPVQTAAGNVTRAAVVAYDAPGGAVLGAIEQGRAYRLLARYGAEWLQIEADGSGAVWVKATQLLGLPELADIQPTQAPAPAPLEAAIIPVPAALVEAAPALQPVAVDSGDEPMSPALMREAMDR